jgi:predicted ferric reductase
MKNIKISLWSILIGLTLLWLLANAGLPETWTFIAVRNLLVQYSGVLSIGAMSVAMLLATRVKWLESWLDGLDKSYRLHKWLGITALVTSVVHWLAANGPKWMVGLGLMERPNRGKPPAGEVELGAIQTFFNSQRGTAELFGEWAFYAAVVLIAIALIKRFPYKFFVTTHTLIAVAYLVLVFHGVVLMNFDAWLQPVGLVTALLMAGGVVSAVLTLTRQIGRSASVSGTIEAVRRFPAMGVTEFHIQLSEGWKGHEGGQFAFVNFDRKEGNHPFTLASAWDPATRKLMIITKGLGDYTDVLPERIKAGDPVTVEGPYGRFTFEDGKDRQVWIGGGIGITPFIARMKQRARTPGAKSIDLIHSVKELDPKALALLTADAEAANVNLHVLVEGRDGRLSGDRLRQMLPDWQSASVWFCGPAAFGESVRADLVAHGLAPKDFHQELFNMR